MSDDDLALWVGEAEESMARRATKIGDTDVIIRFPNR